MGLFLKRLREQRKLSLDAVAQMSGGYPERLTKSHLSRIENGQAEPSFRKLFALSRIYGVPLASLVERLELDFEGSLTRVNLNGKSARRIHREIGQLLRAGRHLDALPLALAAMERQAQQRTAPSAERWSRKFHLAAINCLLRAGYFEMAKAEAELFLEAGQRTLPETLLALYLLVSANYKLRRFSLARILLEQARAVLEKTRMSRRARADFEVLQGNVLLAAGHPREAAAHYDEALEIYRRIGNDFELCRAQVNLGAAQVELGDRKKARAVLEEALALAEARGYARLAALATAHLSLLHYRAGNLNEAERWAVRSNALARPIDYATVIFRNCFYLREIARKRGDLANARVHERTLRVLGPRVEEYLPELEAFRAAMRGAS